MQQPANTIAAIDVSVIQGSSIDWDQVSDAGYSHVFVEVGIGNDSPNGDRASQVTGALSGGLSVQVYDFCYPLPSDGVHQGRDPVAQATLFLQEAANLGLDPQQPVVLDVEWPKLGDMAKWGDNASFVRSWLLACLAEIERVTGVTPWIYGSPSFLMAIGCASEPSFARYKLWLADWGSTPTVPAPWTDWTAWQFSATGSVPGINGAVDLSWVRT